MVKKILFLLALASAVWADVTVNKYEEVFW